MDGAGAQGRGGCETQRGYGQGPGPWMRERAAAAPGSRRTTAPRKTNSKCVQCDPRGLFTMTGDRERRPLPALLLPEIGREYKDLVRTQPPLNWGGGVYPLNFKRYLRP